MEIRKEVASRAVVAVSITKKGHPVPGKAEENPSLQEKTTVYRVQKGDTLGKIARKHGTSVGMLLKLNHMKLRDSLYVNRILKIYGAPAENKENQEKRTPVLERKSLPAQKTGKVIYRVKKGDTLGAIAQKNGTTVSALIKLNRLKPSQSLYVDKKLIISENPGP
jgi:LysM repeat protein